MWQCAEGGEVGRGEAGPLGSVPQRQALALTHGPGIGEWKNTPRKGGCQSQVLCILEEMSGKSSLALFLL